MNTSTVAIHRGFTCDDACVRSRQRIRDCPVQRCTSTAKWGVSANATGTDRRRAACSVAPCLRYTRARVCICVVLHLAEWAQGLSSGRVLSWPLRDFAPVVEVPVVTCQRATCSACAKCASVDDVLSKPYQHHQSPSRRDLDVAVKQAARARWRDQYAPRVDAQVASRMDDCPELDEQELRAALTKQAEVEMETAVRDELAAARFLPKLRTCTRCWTVAYCSKECQAADWSLHKKACVKRSKPAQLEGARAAARLTAEGDHVVAAESASGR